MDRSRTELSIVLCSTLTRITFQLTKEVFLEEFLLLNGYFLTFLGSVE